MTNGVIVREFVKAKATDVDYGIFRARVVEDVVDNLITVEFGSRGGWDGECGTITLTRGELRDALEVLRKAEELMDSIPDDDEFDDDDGFEEDDEFEEDIDEDELDEEWEDEE